MRVKSASLICLNLFLLICCRQEKDYNPTAHLSVPQQDQMMDKVIRYMAKAPEGIAFEERFYKGYNEHYAEQQSLHRLDAYYVDGKIHYFLVSRIAPSLIEKRIAIGGVLQLDDKGGLSRYEEIFRTWKMEPDTLVKRGAFLFDKMVRGEDLKPYYSSISGNTDYIEFPDARTYFDKEKRMWRAKQAN